MSNPVITAILVIFFILGAVMTSKQGAEKVLTSGARTEYFVFIYTPGRAWLKDKPITAQPLNEHFAYMAKLETAKTLMLGGPFKDSSGAIGIIQAPTLREAEEIIANDPAVKDGVVNAEVKRWHPAVVGCLEKKEW